MKPTVQNAVNQKQLGQSNAYSNFVQGMKPTVQNAVNQKQPVKSNAYSNFVQGMKPTVQNAVNQAKQQDMQPLPTLEDQITSPRLPTLTDQIQCK